MSETTNFKNNQTKWIEESANTRENRYNIYVKNSSDERKSVKDEKKRMWNSKLSALGFSKEEFPKFNNDEQIVDYACTNNQPNIIEDLLPSDLNTSSYQRILDLAFQNNYVTIIEKCMNIPPYQIKSLYKNVINYACKNNQVKIIDNLLQWKCNQADKALLKNITDLVFEINQTNIIEKLIKNYKTTWSYICSHIKNIDDFHLYKHMFNFDFLLYLIKKASFATDIFNSYDLKTRKPIFKSIYTREKEEEFLEKTLMFLDISGHTNYKCLQDVFIEACKNNNLNTIEKMKNYDAFNIDSSFNFNIAIRDASGYCRKPEIIDLIYVNESQLKARDTKNKTSFMLAANFNANPDILQKLYDLGSYIEDKDNDGRTALFYAAAYNQNISILQKLYDLGCNLKTIDKNGMTPLMFAAANNKKPEIIYSLVEHGVDVNAKNKKGQPPLMFALRYNENPHIINALIKCGADVNVKDKDGMTPLMFALRYIENPEIFRILMENGAKIEAKDFMTPLILALRYDENPEIIRALMEQGVDVNAKNDDGMTVLMLAIRHKYTMSKYRKEMSNLILSKLSTNQINIIKILINLGADINAKDSNGSTPIDHARKAHIITKLLEEHILDDK